MLHETSFTIAKSFMVNSVDWAFVVQSIKKQCCMGGVKGLKVEKVFSYTIVHEHHWDHLF